MKIDTQAERIVFYIFLILYGGGIIAHLSPSLLNFSLVITEGLLILSNALVVFFVFKYNNDYKLALWCIIAYLITFSCEAIGVASGKVFGVYHYGDTMKWQIWNVPFVIGLNWVILMLAAIHLCQKYLSRNFYPLLSASLLTLFDFIMEPTATHLNYWQWQNNYIPLQNYIAWFLIALGFSIIFKMMDLKVESFLLRAYFLIQIVFFAILFFLI